MEVWHELLACCNEVDDVVAQQVRFYATDAETFNAIELVLSLFVETIASEYSLPLEKLNETVNNFLRQLPLILKNHFESVA